MPTAFSAALGGGPVIITQPTMQQQEDAVPEDFLTWVRPPAPAAPAVWGRHEYQDPAGRTVSYCIRDATPDHHEALLRWYAAEFYHDEPVVKNLKLAQDEVSSAEYSFLVAQALMQGASLVVLEESPEPEVVGAMILPVLSSGDPDLPEFQGQVTRQLMRLVHALRSSAPHCEPLRRPARPVSHYAADLGLWVRRDRRRRGIAEAVLRAALRLCGGLGIPHCSTLFTGAVSQRLARKVGFKEMASLTYADILDEHGQPAFHDMPEECLKLMGVDVVEADLS